MGSKKGKWLIRSGLLLVAAALFLIVYNLRDENRASESVRRVLDTFSEEGEGAELTNPAPENGNEAEIPDYILNPEMDMPVKQIDGWGYIGILTIPSCDLELPILAEWSYPGLKIAPCRYDGSAYSGNLVIAGHNYRSHFGALNRLAEGDAVIFTDVDGNKFSYEVVVRETLAPTAVEDMKSGDWDLTLFTCTLGGRSRMTIRCVQTTGK